MNIDLSERVVNKWQLSVGVTTHNEEKSVEFLLSELEKLDSKKYEIIFYDDASTDKTVRIIKSHTLFLKSNFTLKVADRNRGGPAPGRQWISDHANADYVCLVDGDDFIDAGALALAFENQTAPFDILLTPFEFRGKISSHSAENGRVEVNDETVTSIISGIGGRIYSREVLSRSICHKFIGRSEDARLNMNILINSDAKIYFNSDVVFYKIIESRKSMSAKQIRIDEIRWRVRAFKAISQKYGVSDDYLYAVKRNMLLRTFEDISLASKDRQLLAQRINQAIKSKFSRIALLGNDISGVGGVPSRIRRTLAAAEGRRIEYVAISVDQKNDLDLDNVYCAKRHEVFLEELVKTWKRHDTVVITQNNILQRFPKNIRLTLKALPIVYFGDAQLAFMIQNTEVPNNVAYIDEFKASKIISLSDGDIMFQRQLGITGQVKGFLPIEPRRKNTYVPTASPRLGYIGICDFKAKATDRLIGVIAASRDAGLPPLRIFTTDAKNSPDYGKFLDALRVRGLEDYCDITLNCSDHDRMFSHIDILVVPSRQESFGYAILEAFSYGVPVVACSDAVGPAELIEHGKNGWLIEEFSGENVLSAIQVNGLGDLKRMSKNAFMKHKFYSPQRYCDFLEGVASEVLDQFHGRNKYQVFPKLSAGEMYDSRVKKLKATVDDLILVRDRKNLRVDNLTRELNEARQQLQSALHARGVAEAKASEMSSSMFWVFRTWALAPKRFFRRLGRGFGG